MQKAIPGIQEDRESWEAYLANLWFTLYERGRPNDSSAFEHVFVGEINGLNGKVVGLHNWVQLYLEEKKGALNYKGYVSPGKKRVKKTEVPPDTNERVICIGFTWGSEEHEKTNSTSFVGVSPEFEIALYTLCFLCGEAENVICLGKYELVIKCIRTEVEGLIEAVFPTLVGIKKENVENEI